VKKNKGRKEVRGSHGIGVTRREKKEEEKLVGNYAGGRTIRSRKVESLRVVVRFF